MDEPLEVNNRDVFLHYDVILFTTQVWVMTMTTFWFSVLPTYRGR